MQPHRSQLEPSLPESLGLRRDRSTYEGDPSGELPPSQLVYQRRRQVAASVDGRMALEEQAQAQRGRFYDPHTT